MKLEIAKKIAQNDPEEFRLYEDYSGRGMYGETTAGIVCEGYMLEELAAEYFTVTDSWDECGIDPDDHEDEFDYNWPSWEQDEWFKERYDADKHGFPFRTDNMGLSVIAY